MKFFIIFLLLVSYPYRLTVSKDKELINREEAQTFSKEALQRHLQFLGSDLFEGRGTGAMGGNLAAKYLALEFDKLNLIPPGINQSYYQYIPMHGSIPLPASQLKITTKNDTTSLIIGTDYLLYKGGEQTFVPVPVPLVFVGYGIVAPEYDYNDYQAVDVNGKIVVMLEGEPNANDPGYFDGDKPTIYSYPDSKQRIAVSRGARGSIIIPAPYSDWNTQQKYFSFEDVTLAYAVTGNLSVLINPAIADKLFEGSSYTYEEVYRMHLQNRISSFPLQAYISFNGDFRERDFVSPNIAAIVEGSDPELKSTYIIVSAHYDHLGIGPAIKGDSIYNGVFDNAIGTAALLEIAKEFASLKPAPKRSILFLLLTGEEKGLLGSTYYTDNPLVPLYKTAANINIDGIALFDKFKSVVGIGMEYSTLQDFLIKAAEDNNAGITTIPPQFQDFESFGKSDQVTFAMAGIPSILVTEGIDYLNISKEEGFKKFINYSEHIYHTPFDDLSQPMNFDAVVQHIKIIYDLCYRLAQSEIIPEWHQGVPFINARLRSQAEKK
jgi:hypothetical protein